ncbi:YihY family inner membrane protein [Dokdonella sp.]|uniref:YihY family inner membrane protein n=1 Tax=Dokdonella sp. TaxID=2291710 RepID=UPI0035292A4D
MRTRLDRERSLAFLDFTWERFLEDRCLQTAGALAFTTLFAMVPLTAAILGVLSAFPVFEEWRIKLTVWVFNNFVPAAGDVVQSYLTEFAANASKATAIGVLVLVFSAISLMMSIEDAFNRIWRVKAHRGAVSRFVIYWTALSLGPMLLVAAVAISSYLVALPFIDAAATQFSLKARVLAVLPFLIVWVAMITGYMVIPNRSVRFRDAALGGLIAAILFEAAKHGFAWYAGGIATYQQVYGALSIVPIFFLWMYLSWIIVLLGASMTASLSSFDYRHAEDRIDPDQELSGLLNVIGRLADAHREGRGLHSAELLELEPYLTDDLLQRYLGDLSEVSIIRRTEMDEWILARDLAGITLLDIYRAGNYRLPVGSQRLPGESAENESGKPMQELARTLSAKLKVPLSRIVTVNPPTETEESPEKQGKIE